MELLFRFNELDFSTPEFLPMIKFPIEGIKFGCFWDGVIGNIDIRPDVAGVG